MSKKILYQKIAEELKDKIMSEELTPHDKIPTEAELAERHSVSRITVQRALAELEQQRLIYRIQGKGSFVNDRTEIVPQPKNILFLMPVPDRPSLGIYTQVMAESLRDTSYHFSIQADSLMETESVEYFMKEYAGIILYPPTSHSYVDKLYQLNLHKFPVVLVDKKIDGLTLPTVVADNFQGGYEAALHLINKGHEKLLFLTKGISLSSSIRERYFGYLSALREAGIAYDHWKLFPIDEGDEGSLDPFFKDVLNLMKKDEVTGIVAENDVTVVKFLNIARKYGYHSPGNFSIVGFDNLQIASLFSPSLTTLSQDFSSIGRQAMEAMLNLLKGQDALGHLEIKVPVELVQRESTALVEDTISLS